jgi:transcriptional regulator with XRE-family HTH domain
LRDRVRFVRLQRGKGVNELGAQASLGTGFVSRIESGKRGANPGFDVIVRLAKALGVFASWLATGEPDQGRIYLEDLTKDEELATLRAELAAAKANGGRQNPGDGSGNVRSILDTKKSR